jgi:hypothetical protein
MVAIAALAAAAIILLYWVVMAWYLVATALLFFVAAQFVDDIAERCFYAALSLFTRNRQSTAQAKL